LSGFPTFCFEIAVSNEDGERLLNDAEVKYFSPLTDIVVWMGVKVRRRAAGTDFWAGWGRRKQIGYGLFLMEQTEDANGESTFLPVNAPLLGALAVPSDLIFGSIPVPPGVPLNFVVPLEDIRTAINDGTEWDV
jgi:hypothetical protein